MDIMLNFFVGMLVNFVIGDGGGFSDFFLSDFFGLFSSVSFWEGLGGGIYGLGGIFGFMVFLIFGLIFLGGSGVLGNWNEKDVLDFNGGFWIVGVLVMFGMKVFLDFLFLFVILVFLMILFFLMLFFLLFFLFSLFFFFVFVFVEDVLFLLVDWSMSFFFMFLSGFLGFFFNVYGCFVDNIFIMIVYLVEG